MNANNETDLHTPEEGQDFKKILAIFIDYWYWFVLSVVLFLGAAFVYLRYATPMYKIQATVLVEDPQKGETNSMFGNTGSGIDFSDLFSTKSSVDNEAQILQTKDLMAKVARDMKLYTAYYHEGVFHDVELYHTTPIRLDILSSLDSILSTSLKLVSWSDDSVKIKETALKLDTTYAVAWNKPFACRAGIVLLNKTGIPFADRKPLSVYVAPIRVVAESLQKSVVVEIPTKQVTTINLTYSYSLWDKGEDVLRTIIQDYIRDNILQKNAFADSTNVFIDGRLAGVNRELTDIEGRVKDFKEANHIADIDAQSQQVIESSADYIKSLNTAQVQEQVTESMLKYVQDDKTNKRPVPSLINTPDPTFLVILDKYNSLLAQRDRLAMGSTDQNPLLINLDGQIANARKDLVTSLQNQLAGLRAAETRLQQQNNQINQYISSVPAKEQTFLDLSRRQDIKQALYVFLLQKKEEVAITKASNIASARQIDSPVAESYPYSPKKVLIMGAGLLLGVLVPYGIISLLSFLNFRVSDIGEIKNLTPVTVVGEIMHNRDEIKMVYTEKTRSLIAEQFRALRTNLQFITGETSNPLILFTSSMSGEGKSFIISNLGLAYSAVGKKILLMEMDLRKPRLAANLGLNERVGITNYLTSPITLDEVIVKVPDQENLYVMPSGPIPPNPAELLSGQKMAAMVPELKKRFDLIIVDAPPIGMVTDAQVLVPYADIVLYVVRQNYTAKQQLNIVNDLKSSGKIRNLYIVVNDVKNKASNAYGYGKGYGYGYYGSYGSGVYSDEKPKGLFRRK